MSLFDQMKGLLSQYASGSPGYQSTAPTCAPFAWYSPGPSPKASAHPSSVPSVPQQKSCPGVPAGPTGKPGLAPSAP